MRKYRYGTHQRGTGQDKKVPARYIFGEGSTQGAPDSDALTYQFKDKSPDCPRWGRASVDLWREAARTGQTMQQVYEGKVARRKRPDW